MNLRTFLLIGTALPLALGDLSAYAGSRPALAANEIQIAQACPDGEECPPAKKPKRDRKAKQQPSGEAGTEPDNQAGSDQERHKEAVRKKRAEQQQQQDQGAPAAEPGNQTGADEGGLTSEQAKEQRRKEAVRKKREKQQQQQQQQDQGAPEIAPGDQTGAEEGGLTPDQAREQRRKEAIRKKREKQQQQQQDQGAPEIAPGDQTGADGSDLTPEQAKEQRRKEAIRKKREQQQQQEDQQGVDQTGEPVPPPLEGTDSTVEQQLEAQGDQQEADKVRSLRERLRQQLDKNVFQEQGPPEEQDQGRRRDRDRRDRDRDNRDYDNGWWEHRRDEDVVDRRNGRLIIDLGRGNLYVQPVAPDEGGRLLYGANDVRVEDMPHGWTRTIVRRDNGVEIVTVRNRYGDIVRRTKVLPDGTRIVLIENRGDYYSEDYEAPPPPAPILYDVPPPVVGIPRNRYIVDYGEASEEDIVGALRAPPVQAIQRPYTLNEVLQNQTVRDYSPRIDLDTITFEFGSAVIGVDQMSSLSRLGQAMEQVISENPDEVYLIEGHTDAVGSPEDNLILSDERAEAVATALSQNFDIPPENLVTKGYGEEFLKVNTPAPEVQNRRATVRRLTELLQAQNEPNQ